MLAPWKKSYDKSRQHIKKQRHYFASKCLSFGHLMWRADSLGKTLMLGKTRSRRRGGDRGWDGWMTSLIQWTWVWTNSEREHRTGSLECCCLWDPKESDTTERLNNNIESTDYLPSPDYFEKVYFRVYKLPLNIRHINFEFHFPFWSERPNILLWFKCKQITLLKSFMPAWGIFFFLRDLLLTFSLLIY